MPICQTCGTTFPNRTIISGKKRILKGRKHCLECLPFGQPYEARSTHSRHSREELESAALRSRNMAHLIQLLGLCRSSAMYRSLNSRLERFGIRPNWANKKKITVSYTHNTLFVVNSVTDRSVVRSTIIRDGLLDHTTCAICGMGNSWRGIEMSLILDHINGIRNDHRLENLRFLCPNCNSTLPTHGSKNKEKYSQKPNPTYRKCEGCDELISHPTQKYHSRQCNAASTANKRRKVAHRPDPITLEADVKELGYVGTGRKYGVSDNAIRKWLKKK